jgi:hypothetical protein
MFFFCLKILKHMESQRTTYERKNIDHKELVFFEIKQPVEFFDIDLSKFNKSMFKDKNYINFIIDAETHNEILR